MPGCSPTCRAAPMSSWIVRRTTAGRTPQAGGPSFAPGAPAGASYFFFGAERGGILYDPSQARLKPGDVITCVVPHCDPTVNLYDRYHVVRGDVLEAIWPRSAEH